METRNFPPHIERASLDVLVCGIADGCDQVVPRSVEIQTPHDPSVVNADATSELPKATTRSTRPSIIDSTETCVHAVPSAEYHRDPSLTRLPQSQNRLDIESYHPLGTVALASAAGDDVDHVLPASMDRATTTFPEE